MHARRCYALYVCNKGAVSLLCLQAAHLTFWLGARQERCGNFLQSTGLCLYESPSYNLSTHIWHSGQCFLLRRSFLPETISASLSQRGRQTFLLSPQPVQMSCYCLVRNKKPQSWGRIRHKRGGSRCLFPYTGIYWLAGAAWWIHEDIFQADWTVISEWHLTSSIHHLISLTCNLFLIRVMGGDCPSSWVTRPSPSHNTHTHTHSMHPMQPIIRVWSV